MSKRNPVPLIIAHRGGAQGNPLLENRLATFERMLATGVDMVECDVHLSADNEVVVIHDETLDRTTTGRGCVNAYTAEELAAFGVPTLRQLLQLAHGKARVLIEIKSASPYRVMDAIAAERMERGVIVISFSPEYLRPVARQRPEVERALLLWKFENDVPNLAMFIRLGRELQATTLAPCIELCTPELVAAIHAAGLRVFVWTANTPEQQRAMRNAGVDGIISDFPDRLKSNL